MQNDDLISRAAAMVEIKGTKRSIHSDNTDYENAYLCALSVAEGILAGLQSPPAMVLPCAVGDVCYEVDTIAHGVITHTVTALTYRDCFSEMWQCQRQFWIIETNAVDAHGDEWPDTYSESEWLSRILTREAADAALKAREGESNG